MKNGDLFKEEDFKSCLARIENLGMENTAQWGTMDISQMLAHCAEVQEVLNGKALKDTPFLLKLFKGFIKKSVISKKPYPKNSKTHPQYIVESKKDFTAEKTRLVNALQNMQNERIEDSKSITHTLFGNMSRAERGWAAYKHLDHHLNQFGV